MRAFIALNFLYFANLTVIAAITVIINLNHQTQMDQNYFKAQAMLDYY